MSRARRAAFLCFSLSSAQSLAVARRYWWLPCMEPAPHWYCQERRHCPSQDRGSHVLVAAIHAACSTLMLPSKRARSQPGQRGLHVGLWYHACSLNHNTCVSKDADCQFKLKASRGRGQGQLLQSMKSGRKQDVTYFAAVSISTSNNLHI